jgi:hypothetical protein
MKFILKSEFFNDRLFVFIVKNIQENKMISWYFEGVKELNCFNSKPNNHFCTRRNVVFIQIFYFQFVDIGLPDLI